MGGTARPLPKRAEPAQTAGHDTWARAGSGPHTPRSAVPAARGCGPGGIRDHGVRRRGAGRRCPVRSDQLAQPARCPCSPRRSSRSRSNPCRPGWSGAAANVLRGGAPSPYEVLSRFSENVTGSYATEELPLADGHPARRGHRCRLGPGLAHRPGRADPRGQLAGERASRSAKPRSSRPTPATRPARDGAPCRCAMRARCWQSCGCRNVRACRSPRSRSGCSPGSPPRRGWCCGWPGYEPSWPPGTTSWQHAPTSCACPANGSSRPRTPSGAGSSATSMTARSSTWWRSP